MPWVTEENFIRTPFNYCDHFGDKQTLAKMCKICQDEWEDTEKYRLLGQDPNKPNLIMAKVAKELSAAMRMLSEQAKEIGITLELNEKEELEYMKKHDLLRNLRESHPVYLSAVQYGKKVREMINLLEDTQNNEDHQIHKALQALFHSQFYIQSKVNRALDSLADDPYDDSKTSAFLAYVAALRNCYCFLSLADKKKFEAFRPQYLQFSKESLNISKVIHMKFFPNYQPDIEEYGCEDYPIVYIP